MCSYLLKLVPRSQILLPWRWRRYVPPKRRFTQKLHGATSHKTAFFIVTAVKTSNLRFLTRLRIWRQILCPPKSRETGRRNSLARNTNYTNCTNACIGMNKALLMNFLALKIFSFELSVGCHSINGETVKCKLDYVLFLWHAQYGNKLIASSLSQNFSLYLTSPTCTATLNAISLCGYSSVINSHPLL
jgi:hypothetical protein